MFSGNNNDIYRHDHKFTVHTNSLYLYTKYTIKYSKKKFNYIFGQSVEVRQSYM